MLPCLSLFLPVVEPILDWRFLPNAAVGREKAELIDEELVPVQGPFELLVRLRRAGCAEKKELAESGADTGSGGGTWC